VRVVGGGFGAPSPGRAHRQLDHPCGLRFTGGGHELVVADSRNDRVSMFRVEDGSFLQHLALGLEGPSDVEEYAGGWLVACSDSHTVEFLGDGLHAMHGCSLGRASFCWPSALALVPGLGLVVREDGNHGRVQFFATPDAIAMASMSAARVGWIVAVARGAAHRAPSAGGHHQQTRPTGKKRWLRGSGR
jgi:hypothetical protein